MKKLKIMETLGNSLNKASFKLKKHSPEILVVAGVIGTVASVVLACKATTKISAIIDQTKENVDATATMQYFKRKYEQISQAEINSVKEVFAKKKEDIPDEVKVFKPKEKKNMAEPNDLEEMHDKIKENGYTNYADIATKKDGETVSANKPYVISPEEFGEDDDYTKSKRINKIPCGCVVVNFTQEIPFDSEGFELIADTC